MPPNHRCTCQVKTSGIGGLMPSWTTIMVWRLWSWWQEMNQKTLQWPMKLVLHLANMAKRNAYLLWHRSQQTELQVVIMQEQRVKKLPQLRENLQLHSHATFRSTVVMALVEEGNWDWAFANPSKCIMSVCPKQWYNEWHFPELILPVKVGGGYITAVMPAIKHHKARTQNFVALHATSSCVLGCALLCTTPKIWCTKMP